MPEFAGDADVCQVVTQLVNQKAYPDSEPCALTGDLEQAQQTLLQNGYIVGLGGRFRLTVKALSALGVHAACKEPRPVSAARELPLQELTDYELMVKLEEGGWAWQKYSKALPDYVLGGPKVWSTRGISERSLASPYIAGCVREVPSICVHTPRAQRASVCKNVAGASSACLGPTCSRRWRG